MRSSPNDARGAALQLLELAHLSATPISLYGKEQGKLVFILLHSIGCYICSIPEAHHYRYTSRVRFALGKSQTMSNPSMILRSLSALDAHHRASLPSPRNV